MKINIKEIFNNDSKKDENWISSALEPEAKQDAAEDEAESILPAEAQPDVELEPEPEHKAQEEPEASQTVKAEPETKDEPELKAESETNKESIQTAVQPEVKQDKAEADPEPKEEVAAEEESPAEEQALGEEAGQPEREALHKKYGWVLGIAAVFAVLILSLVVYTTMIPKDVYATINGETHLYTSTEHTIEGFLEDEGIAYCDEDRISTPITAFIHDGIRFTLNHAMDFTVTADGKTTEHKALGDTVKGALADENIRVGRLDIVKPALDTDLKNNMNIIIQRVKVKEKIVEENVPYKTVTKDEPSMDEGTTKVVTEGKDGKDKVTYKITYIDGAEASRKEIGRETVTAVTDKVVANGTRINLNGISYSKKLTVKAYAYTGGGTTAMGTRARVGEIAVDPRVIPLGTKVYIEGVGVRRAEDTGGNIKGNTIDIYMDTQAQCRSWGVRYVTIYIQ